MTYILKYMKQKKTMTKIVARGASQPCVGECAAAGEATASLNVRECDDALRVVGQPATVGQLAAGDRLLLVDGNRRLTLRGRQVMHADAVLTQLDGELVGTHRIGDMVVLTTTNGAHWLHRTAESYVAVRVTDACPTITLTALESDTVGAAMEAVTFGTSYSQWPAPLEGGDVSRLTSLLRRSWNELQQGIDAVGAYGGTMLVRCGVRLTDDSYPWLSDAVTLGDETQTDNTPVTAECTLDGTTVTGIPATTLTRHRWRVGITVQSGIADVWRPLVAAVDILATRCVDPVLPGGTAQYRGIGIGGSVRRPRLEFGLPPVSAATIAARLLDSGWHVVASTSDLEGLNRHEWVSDAVSASPQVVTPGLTSYVVTRPLEATDRLTAREAQDVEQNTTPLVSVASTCCNGRLYSIDAAGRLAMSRPGNPLVHERQRVVTGTVVRAIAPLGRAIYSNGFGRYPLALFTDEGIYALPQTTAAGTPGEPRLLDRTVIAAGSRPVEGGRDLYFVSHRGHLCRLRGSEVTVVWRDTGVCQAAWDDAHGELWALLHDGTVLALMPSGRASRRSVACRQLYDDATHALAIDAEGHVLDLTHEVASSSQAVEWLSHPLASERPHQVVWQVMGTGTLTLMVRGERSMSCHGFVVGSLRVSGTVYAPLRQRLLAQPLRTIRLQVSGRADSGTLLLPTLLG